MAVWQMRKSWVGREARWGSQAFGAGARKKNRRKRDEGRARKGGAERRTHSASDEQRGRRKRGALREGEASERVSEKGGGERNKGERGEERKKEREGGRKSAGSVHASQFHFTAKYTQRRKRREGIEGCATRNRDDRSAL